MCNTQEFEKRAKELVSKMTLEEKVAQMKFDAPAIERLGVPAYNWWNECLHGVARSGSATVFPQAIGMAASFNPLLMNEVATAISNEARAKYNEYKKLVQQIFIKDLLSGHQILIYSEILVGAEVMKHMAKTLILPGLWGPSL